MKTTETLRAGGSVDDDLIERAAQKNASQRISPRHLSSAAWLRIAVPAAACLAIAASILLWRNGLPATPAANNDSLSVPPAANNAATSTHNPTGPGDSDANTFTPGLPDKEWPPEPGHGVYIPGIELPERTDGEEFSMIGLIVYQGRIYTSAAWYYNKDAEYIIENLVGDRVGFAKGNIHEWSTQDDFAVELAGSVYGDVYAVSGYNSWYRLCMIGNYTDDYGNDVQWANFFECLNGYGMTNGYELFVFGSLMDVYNGEIRSRNWSHVKYQDHDNWDYADPIREYVYHDLKGVSDEDITAFLYELYFGQFEDVHETANDNFQFRNERQTHLQVYMDDNTVIELRLFEGGYVGYRHLGWYFVKIPGEAFDTIFNACT